MDGEEEDVDGVHPRHRIAQLAVGPYGVPALISVRLGLGQEAALLLLLNYGVVAVRINLVKPVHVEQ